MDKIFKRKRKTKMKKRAFGSIRIIFILFAIVGFIAIGSWVLKWLALGLGSVAIISGIFAKFRNKDNVVSDGA